MTSDNSTKKPGKLLPISPGHLMMHRVIINGDYFICGICRSRHASVNQAKTCVLSCWRALLDRAPWVLEVKGIGKQPFACNYCRRGYPSAQEAHACAQDCINRILKNASAEGSQKIHKVTRNFKSPNARSTYRIALGHALSKRHSLDARHSEETPTTQQPNAASFTCEFCKSTHETKDAADECFSSHEKKIPENS